MALTLARRELRGSLGKFRIFLACLALGVALVTALGTLSEAVRQGLAQDARAILGGDVELSRSHLALNATQQAFLAGFGRISHQIRLRAMARTVAPTPTPSASGPSGFSGLSGTRARSEEVPAPSAADEARSATTTATATTSTTAPGGAPTAPVPSTPVAPRASPSPLSPTSLLSPSSGARSALVEVKAVDDAYPLYGAVRLEPDMPLSEALAPRDGVPGAVVERALLARLGLTVGDRLRLGRATLRIGAVLTHEPDRAASFFGLGPRLLLRDADLAATGLLLPGAVVRHAYKVRLPEAATAAAATTRANALHARIEARYPASGLRWRDIDSTDTPVARGMKRMTSYLALVGLAALLIGGIGAAGAARGYLATKLATIATLKCLGAARATVLRAYLLQIAALALAGSLAGLAAGLAVAWGAGRFLATSLDMHVRFGLYAGPLFTALGCGLATAVTFCLPPLSAAAAVRPARLFRGYAEPAPTRPGPWALLGTVLGACALSALALSVAQSTRIGLGFVAGAVGCSVVFGLFARLLARAARRLHPRDPRLRHALAGLHRPGAPTASIVFSLGLGLTALAAVVLVQGNIRHRLAEQIPDTAPAFFFLNIPQQQAERFAATVRAFPGVARFEQQPSLRARIQAINGTPVENATVGEGAQWAVRGDRGTTFLARPPDNLRLTAGEWWPEDYQGPPILCLDARMAEGFDVGVGDTLTINVQGRAITATIHCLREIDWGSLALNHSIIFAPGAIDHAPHTDIATAYLGAPGAQGNDAAGGGTANGNADGGAKGPDPLRTEAGLTRAVADAFPDVGIVHVRDVLGDVGAILGQINAAVAATAAVTLLAALLVLAEALRANLATRQRDAVIFKVLGATRRDILATLALEFVIAGAATALLATALGTAAAWTFNHFILHAPWTNLPWHSLGVTLGGTAVTALLGLLRLRHTLNTPPWPILRND
ncbi:MAG: FtsX-like permease family protein [Desulfovibrionaceae bacterium]|jgi:putative ABC transport system permease protein|nr:FtsX-like permease family protein [Desulfovibrionaceae bacterium]